MKYVKIRSDALEELEEIESFSINDLTKILYKYGRGSRDAKAILKAIKKGSPMPIIKRMWNKWVG